MILLEVICILIECGNYVHQIIGLRSSITIPVEGVAHIGNGIYLNRIVVVEDHGILLREVFHGDIGYGNIGETIEEGLTSTGSPSTFAVAVPVLLK